MNILLHMITLGLLAWAYYRLRKSILDTARIVDELTGALAATIEAARSIRRATADLTQVVDTLIDDVDEIHKGPK